MCLSSESNYRLLVGMSMMILDFRVLIILRPLAREILLLLTSGLLVGVVSSVPWLPSVCWLASIHGILIPSLIH